MTLGRIKFQIGDGGATMVEFTLIVFLFLVMTFGIVELGYLFWQWNSAEKATQIGVRKAIVWDPVAAELKTWDCCGGTLIAGQQCDAGGGATFGTVTCTSTGCGAGYTLDASAFNAIVASMQAAFTRILPENVQVEYRHLANLGFCKGPPIAEVTVELRNMTYDPVIMGPLVGFTSFGLPSYRATLTSEDLNMEGTSP